MGDTIGLCWGGGGPPKSSFKNKVFGSVFRYLKVALRLKVCVDTTIGLVLLPLHLTLSCCLLVFLVRGDIHCAGGVPAGVVFSPHS